MESLPKVGIFGGGPLTNEIVPSIKKAGFDIIAVWTEISEEADHIAQKFGIEFSSSNMDDVLLHKDVGLLIILSPPITHSQIAVKALGIGKHVYVSAPCSINTAQVLRMVQSAAYYPNLIARVGYCLRSCPVVSEMKQRISDGYLGKSIKHCDARINCPSLVARDSSYSWRCSEIMGGGVLAQYGNPLFDLISYLTNQKVSTLHGVVRTVQNSTQKINGIRTITADDVVSLTFETLSNTLGTMTLSSLGGCDGAFNQELIMTGDEGQLILRNSTLYGRKFLDNTKETLLLSTNDDDVQTSSTSTTTATELPEMYLSSYTRQFSELKLLFLNQLDDHNDRLASFEDALYTASIIEAVRQSSMEKSWVKVLNEK